MTTARDEVESSLSQLIQQVPPTWRDRLRTQFGRRAAGLVLALLVEGLLVLLLLTLSPSIVRHEEAPVTVFSLDPDADTPSEPAPAREPAPASPEPPAAEPQPPEPQPQPRDPAPVPAQPAQPQPAPAPPPMIPLSREQMAAADITPQPARPAGPSAPRRPVVGPPNTGGGRPGWADTPRVEGTGPHGEPLYAAAWYREPYDDELRGYLSTARGPGWALIACRTVVGYRVEDCVKVAESPEGSNIARAVLAAAWQFRVRPPQIGGELKFGEWVRIRIDYDQRSLKR